MRVLILGGTVFLSAATAREALRRGHEVTCLARGSTGRPPEGVNWIQADRDDGPDLYPSGEWDVVIDVTRHPRHAREALAAMGDATGHWTLVSSCSVYADHSVPDADESASLLPAYGEDLMESMEVYGEAKVACEEAALEALASRLHISRAGLICGAGDGSDRFGYWPARFFRRGDDRVLVPDVVSLTQVIGVADLSRWLLDAAETNTVGILNSVGDVLPLPELFDLIQETVEHTGEQVRVGHDWLVDQGIDYWAGDESLPLWLPSDFEGFAARSNAAAKAAGMRLSPLDELIQETLEYERKLGVDRERKAGLTPEREQQLLELWDRR